MTEQTEPKTGAGRRRDAPLAMEADEFRRVGHQLVDTLASFLESLPGRPVTPAESPEAIRAALDASRPLPNEGEEAAALIDRAARLLVDHSLFNGHPRFVGYVTSPPAPIGILADLLG